LISPEWPELPYAEWEKTCDTLHMWTQIAGKTRMALTPLENHWWNVTLVVTPRGLRTPPIPWRQETFEVEFDLLGHRLAIRTSEGRERGIPLYPRSVADFYAEYTANLASLGIEVHIDPTPQEFDDLTPHDRDQHHASYDTRYVERFRRVLINADRALKKFRARFIGKSSPVQFFWGSFDLAVTRFCGRRAELPADADHMTREAYSHEVISCGFWPGDRRYPHAAFYAYAKPAPPGIEKARVRPEAARWAEQMGEFFLSYEDARKADSPEEAILEFCQSTYEAGAELGGWDRGALER
jgi:Family of unknown function (DUF5996)